MSKPKKPNRKLQHEREIRGWSQQKVASEIDADEKRVGIWERGESTPSPYYRQKLCQLFGKNAQELGFLDATAHGDSRRESFHIQPANLPGIVSGRSTLIEQGEAIPAGNVAPDQQSGLWLALSTQNLTPLFDEGWTSQMILEALQVLLPGVHAMSQISRRTFGHQMLQLGATAFLGDIPIPTGKHVTAEERYHLHQTLGESIAAGWSLFHTANNAQVLAVGQVELALIQQAHALLYPQIRSILYTGVYNLIGRAYHLQEHYEEALQAHMGAHVAALGTGDPLYVSQSLICQADTYQALGQHTNAIQCIEEALRILGHHDEEHVRSHAHLLGCWADNAMTMQEFTLAQHKLAEAEPYLDGIGQKEEFDRASWLQLAGKRAIMAGEYRQAVSYLEEANTNSPPQWLVRRAGILIPLAIAYARMGERDMSLQVAQQAVPVLIALNAPMSNRHFADYLRQDILEFFPHDEQIQTFVSETRHKLPQIAALIG